MNVPKNVRDKVNKLSRELNIGPSEFSVGQNLRNPSSKENKRLLGLLILERNRLTHGKV